MLSIHFSPISLLIEETSHSRSIFLSKFWVSCLLSYQEYQMINQIFLNYFPLNIAHFLNIIFSLIFKKKIPELYISLRLPYFLQPISKKSNTEYHHSSSLHFLLTYSNVSFVSFLPLKKIIAKDINGNHITKSIVYVQLLDHFISPQIDHI